MDATGRAPARVSPPTVFIEAGESAATVVLTIAVEPAAPGEEGQGPDGEGARAGGQAPIAHAADEGVRRAG